MCSLPFKLSSKNPQVLHHHDCQGTDRCAHTNSLDARVLLDLLGLRLLRVAVMGGVPARLKSRAQLCTDFHKEARRKVIANSMFDSVTARVSSRADFYPFGKRVILHTMTMKLAAGISSNSVRFILYPTSCFLYPICYN